MYTEEEDIKNIEKLRIIVDESDKLYYDNLKANEEENKNDTVNNFKAKSMENLESEDPWLNRKKEE